MVTTLRAALGLAAVLYLPCRRAAPPAEGAEPEAPPVRVTCAPVARATLRDARALRGTVVAAPDRDAVVSPQVPGRVVRVPVRVGDPVAAGAVVAEIESQALRDAAVQARAQLAEAQANATNAAVAAGRTQRLYERGIAARQEADDANARSAGTRAVATAARAALDVAERNVARAVVRAPIAGVIVRVMRQAGEVVDGTPATPVLEVADPRALEFLATAPPADLVLLRAGQPGEARFDALPGRGFALAVRSVSPAVDPATGVGAVRFTLTALEVRPPFGLYGTATVVVGDHPNALVVPPAALRSGATGLEVVVCAEGHARVQAVEVGAREPTRVEVVHGLEGAESIVADGALGLADGAAIVTTPP